MVRALGLHDGPSAPLHGSCQLAQPADKPHRQHCTQGTQPLTQSMDAMATCGHGLHSSVPLPGKHPISRPEHQQARPNTASQPPTWSLEASMPMLRAMALTTVGPAPLNSPMVPSSFTIRVSALVTAGGRRPAAGLATARRGRPPALPGLRRPGRRRPSGTGGWAAGHRRGECGLGRSV